MSGSLTLAARLSAAAVLAGACGSLAACGTGSPGAPATHTVTIEATPGSTSTSAAPVAASSSVTAAGPSGCLASALQAQLGTSQGAAGTIYQVVAFTNTSNSTCTLYGYPGVSFVTGAGSQVGKPAVKNPVVPKTLVTLAPGAEAAFLLGVHVTGAYPTCKVTSVAGLRIYPPGDYGSITVHYKGQACDNRTFSILSVSPVRAGANPTF